MNPHQGITDGTDAERATPPDELLTVPEVASRLRVSEETIRAWLRSGALRGANLGGRAGWRVFGSEIQLLLQRKTSPHGHAPGSDGGIGG